MSDPALQSIHVPRLLRHRLPHLYGDEAKRPSDEERKIIDDEIKRQELICEEMRQRMKLAEDFPGEADQRKRERDDLYFDAVDQWDDDVKRTRQGQTDNRGNKIPDLPVLTIDRLDQPIQHVEDEIRNANLEVSVKPKGGEANDKTAEVFKGVMRAIQFESRANSARLWAAGRAARCGRGWYRILTDYANDEDDDLDIIIARILHQHLVYADPTAQEPDWRDGRWAVLPADFAWDEYLDRYGDNSRLVEQVERLQLDSSSLQKNYPGWITEEENKLIVRVAEYFRLVETYEPRVYHKTWGRFIHPDDVPPDLRELLRSPELKTRQVPRRRVEWFLANALEILEQQQWPGPDIPLIPTYGKEYNVSGTRVWKGIVTKAKNAQQAFNVMRSRMMQTIGLASIAPWIADPRQLENFEHIWNDSNVRPFTILPYNAVMEGDQLLPPPQRNTVEPAIQAILMAAREHIDDLHAVTGWYGAALADVQPDQSGIALKRSRDYAQAGTSIYLDNMAEVSMPREAEILLRLIPKVYDRKGRVLRILGEDEKEQEVMLGQPFMQMQGRPMAVPEGQPVPEDAELYDLAKGVYRVQVSVGERHETMRDEANSFFEGLARSIPELAGRVADLWANTLNFKGKDKAVERLKPPDADSDIPPKVAQVIEMMQADLQQAKAVIDEQQKILDAKVIEQKGKERLQEAELAAKRDLEELKATVQLQEQRLENFAKLKEQDEEGKIDIMLKRMDMIIAEMKIAADKDKAEMAAKSAEKKEPPSA